MTIYNDIEDERERAHLKHGDQSMRAMRADDPARLAVLAEELGEVAKVLNDWRHCPGPGMLMDLREELVQVAAMATDWAVACDE